MALSKEGPGLTVLLTRGCDRLSAPLAELADDMGSWLAGFVGAASAKEVAKVKREFLQEFADVADAGMAWAHNSRAAIAELAEDFGVPGAAVPAAIALLAGPGPNAVMLCGMSVPLKAVYAAAAMAMGVAAYAYGAAGGEAGDRWVSRRAGIVLATCSTLHLLMAVLGAAPYPMARLSLYPEIATHVLEDLVANPLMVLNLGAAAGVAWRELLPAVRWSLGGAVAGVGAACAPSLLVRLGCLLAGAGCVALVVQEVQRLPQQARSVSEGHELRCEKAVNFMILGWSSSLLLQGWGLLDGMTPPMVLPMMDVMVKVGATHLMLRPIPAALLRVPAQAQTAVPRFQAPRELPEPCSEPPPENQEAAAAGSR